MFARGFVSIVRRAAGAMVAVLLFVSIVSSESRAATVAEFVANPAQVMAQYPNGGADLISLIRDVATTTPSALATIAGYLSSGTGSQQKDLGTGLGLAYAAVLASDQAYAAQIAAAVAASNSDDAKTSYAAATGNVATAATGGGGGGAGGGSGGTAGGGAGSNSPTGGSNSGATGTSGSAPTQTSANTFTGGGGGVSGLNSSAEIVSPR